MPLYTSTLPSPLGEIVLESDGEFLTGLSLGGTINPEATLDTGPFRAALRQLKEYFAGDRTEFELPMKQTGTEFQQRVWEELQRIPFGTTISYAELAERVGMPKAARAVGSANGKNQIALIVPCHRVIAAGGKLGGYSGGLWRKEFLLDFETKRCRSTDLTPQPPLRRGEGELATLSASEWVDRAAGRVRSK